MVVQSSRLLGMLALQLLSVQLSHQQTLSAVCTQPLSRATKQGGASPTRSSLACAPQGIRKPPGRDLPGAWQHIDPWPCVLPALSSRLQIATNSPSWPLAGGQEDRARDPGGRSS